MKAGYPVVTVEKLPKVKIVRIKAKELKKLIDSKANIVIVDIRPQYELVKSAINAEKIDADLTQLSQIADTLPRDKKIIIVDLNGKRGGVAYRYFVMKGLKDLALLNGGMQKWIKAGLPVK